MSTSLQPIKSSGKSVPKPVVLCVDDEPTVLESLRIELRQVLGSDCLIETAEGGQEALEVLEELQQAKQDIALVLADYIMPGMKGDELLKQIHARSPKTLNIMLTGQADLEAIGRAIQYGKLYRYIAKPWQPKDLRLTVTEAIQSYLKDQLLEAQTEKLHQMTQEMQQLNASLEQQVQIRTAQLQEKMAELAELNQLKDNFLHSVSHDLRTPLMGTLLVLQNLQQTSGDQIVLSRSILDRMVQSCQRQLEMLNSLLQIQFSEVRGLYLRQEWINLGELVQSIAQELEPLIQHHQAHLTNRVSQDLPFVFADSSQLKRVFENLISNALKHNPPGIEIQLKAAIQMQSEHLPDDSLSNSLENSLEDSLQDPLGNLSEDSLKNSIKDSLKNSIKDSVKDSIKDSREDSQTAIDNLDSQANLQTVNLQIANLQADNLQPNPYNSELNCYSPHRSVEEVPVLCCRILDNGIGMNQQECNALFERYTQSTRTRRSPGVGLGLYLCRQIITAHGGRIGACSAVGKGTEFWFTLPLSPIAPDVP